MTELRFYYSDFSFAHFVDTLFHFSISEKTSDEMVMTM